VAPGIFGVLWNTINKQLVEIGLRKAIGAFLSNISVRIIEEMLVLTTLGVIMGYLPVFQFPLLNMFNISRDGYGLAILIATFCSSSCNHLRALSRQMGCEHRTRASFAR